MCTQPGGGGVDRPGMALAVCVPHPNSLLACAACAPTCVPACVRAGGQQQRVTPEYLAALVATMGIPASRVLAVSASNTLVQVGGWWVGEVVGVG